MMQGGPDRAAFAQKLCGANAQVKINTKQCPDRKSSRTPFRIGLRRIQQRDVEKLASLEHPANDPKKWTEFRRRYRQELQAHADALAPILKAAWRGRVTLVYSSHDTAHNNAVALKAYLDTKMGKKRAAHKPPA
jgi:hypothetical protein